MALSFGAVEVRKNEALRWNGVRWSLSHTPDPDGTASGDAQDLTGASCLSRTNCWAVGQSGMQVQPTGVVTEALHWNGTKWAKVTTPDPAGAATNHVDQLFGVRCVTARDCWAVGNQDSGGPSHDLIVHWNGHTWSAS